MMPLNGLLVPISIGLVAISEKILWNIFSTSNTFQTMAIEAVSEYLKQIAQPLEHCAAKSNLPNINPYPSTYANCIVEINLNLGWHHSKS